MSLRIAIDCDEILDDRIIKKISKGFVSVKKYPNIGQLIELGCKRMIIKCPIDELDGDNKSMNCLMIASECKVIKNFNKIRQLFIENERDTLELLDYNIIPIIHIDVINKLIIKKRTQSLTKIFYDDINELDVPNSVCLCVTQHNVLKKKYESLYHLAIYHLNNETLNFFHIDYLNVNILIICCYTKFI